MITVNRLLKGYRKISKKIKRHPALEGNPQRKGVCISVMIMKPRKPNSASRKVAKVRLNNNKTVYAHIPGENHNAQDHAVLCLAGKRVSDLPSIKLRCIRGRYNLNGAFNRKQGRSRYGAKK